MPPRRLRHARRRPPGGASAPALTHAGRAAQDGQLDQYIDRLRFAATELLVRLSRRFQRRRQGTIFLVTNLTHVAQARRWPRPRAPTWAGSACKAPLGPVPA